MFATIAATVAATLGVENLRRFMCSSIEQPFGRFSRTDSRVVLEILVSHLAHAATLETKSQFVTWLVTFVSAAYKGAAHKVIKEKIVEMVCAFGQEPSVQSGEAAMPPLRGEDDEEQLERWLSDFLDDTGEEYLGLSTEQLLSQYFDPNTYLETLGFLLEHPCGTLDFASIFDGDGDFIGVQAGFSKVQSHFSFGVDTFKAIRNTPYYKHGRKIIAMCFAASVLNDALFQAHPWFHKRLFDGIDHKAGVDPVDLLDETLDLTNCVMKTAAQCISEKSMGPMLGRGRTVVDIDVEHAWLKAHVPIYLNGQLQAVTEAEGARVADAEFHGRVARHLLVISNFHKSSTGAERVNIAAKLNDANCWNTTVVEFIGRASSRVEPYLIGLWGRTGQGKTVAANLMAKHTLQCNGFPHTQDYLAQVDPDSNFMDSVTNKTLAVFIDDLANTIPAFSMTNELMALIRLKNTANVPVNKADLADKGRTFHNCRVVIISSNAPMLGADVTQCEPSATMRRFNLMIYVETREQYARPMEVVDGNRPLNMVDPGRLNEGLYTPYQSFTLKHWIPRATAGKDVGVCVTLKDDTGAPLEGLTYNQVMRYIAHDSARHFTGQAHLQNALRYDETLPICPHGGTPAPFCPECRAEDPTIIEHALKAIQFEHQAGEGTLPFEAGFPTEDEPPQLSDRVTAALFPPENSPASSLGSNEFSIASESSSVTLEQPPLSRFRRVSDQVRAGIARASSQWSTFSEGPPPPEAPRFVGVIRAATHGKFDIEDYAVTHFDRVMTGMCCVAPALASVTSSFCWLIGFGAIFSSVMWTSVFLFTTRTIVRTSRAWIAGRVAGATLAELKKKSMTIVGRSLVVLGGVLAALTALKAMQKVYRAATAPRASESVPLVKQVVCEPGDPRTVICRETLEALQRTTAQNEALTAFAAAMMDHKDVVPRYDTQGGALSQDRVLHDPLPKTNTWENRDLVSWRRLDDTSRTMTADQVVAKLARQVFVMDIFYATGKVTSNCFFIATNYILAPAHNFLRVSGEYSAIDHIGFRATTEVRGPVFTARVCPTQMLRLPGDMMLVQVNAGGTMVNMLEFVAEREIVGTEPILELHRNLKTCEVERRAYLVKADDNIKCTERGMCYRGYAGVRPGETFVGLCGSLIVASRHHPKIISIHTMGAKRVAVSCSLDRAEVEQGIADLARTGLIKAPIINQPHTTPYTSPDMAHAAQVVELSKRSVLGEAPNGTGILPVGTVKDYTQVRQRTQLDTSPISEQVTAICGEERKHGPPVSMGKATVEKAKLIEMSEKGYLPIEDLKLAIADIKAEARQLIISTGFAAQLRPLDVHEAVAGKAGMHTIRKINTKTAAGFPYVGSKLFMLDHEELEGLPDALVFTPEMEEELARVIAIMAVRERLNFVFKASHKDEAVKIGKLKTRIFEGSPTVFTVIVRMYFLPILRLFMLAREESRSAVGIDATSCEWDAMHRFQREYNDTEGIAGDWQHLDTSETYIEMMLVLGMLVELVEEFGAYTSEDINVMWTAAEELARHMSLMRGDLFFCEGSNASGQGATVDTNNLIVAVRLIAQFYSGARELKEPVHTEPWEPADRRFTCGGLPISPGSRAELVANPLVPMLNGRYSDYARTMHYGDDFTSAVKACALPWHNQFTLEAYFAEHGLVLTDPSKGPFTAATTPWKDVTFLKREFRYDAELDAYMGALELTSIYKPFHVWPNKREMSVPAHTAMLLGGAFRELFQHGRAVFEAKSGALKELAEATGAMPYLVDTPMTYDELKELWELKRLARKVQVAELHFGSE